jgi:hypothetical protein
MLSPLDTFPGDEKRIISIFLRAGATEPAGDEKKLGGNFPRDPAAATGLKNNRHEP